MNRDTVVRDKEDQHMLLRSNKRTLTVCTFLVLLLIPTLSSAADTQGHAIQHITPNGYYDWTTNTATATGLGVPRQDIENEFQLKEMTRTAAWSVALANLLEVVNGIRVSADTTVHDHVTTDSQVRTRVEGMVRKAIVIDEEELPKGAIKTTVQMRVTSAFTDVLLPSPSSPDSSPTPAPLPHVHNPIPDNPNPGNKGTGKGNANTSQAGKGAQSVTPQKAYTGVLIDARGVTVKQALRPRILTRDRHVIYDKFKVGESNLTGSTEEDQKRTGWYVADAALARRHAKTGGNPLLIKAAGAEKTDLLIDIDNEEWVKKVKGHPECDELLYKAKVVILTDPTSPVQ